MYCVQVSLWTDKIFFAQHKREGGRRGKQTGQFRQMLLGSGHGEFESVLIGNIALTSALFSALFRNRIFEGRIHTIAFKFFNQNEKTQYCIF
jgi:hypothetical protein